MLDELRDRIGAYLASYRVCVVCANGSATPVRYRSIGLEVDCLVPRWAEAAYHLEQDPRVLLIVQREAAEGLRWLELRGLARTIPAPDWNRLLPEGVSSVRPDERYLAIRVTPERIDLLDEGPGWGARETLELR